MKEVSLSENEYKMATSLDGVERYLYKSYLDDLDKRLPVVKEDVNFDNLNALSNKVNGSTRFLKLTRLVLDKGKDHKHILVSVYKSIYNLKSSFVLLINGKEDSVDFYLGVKRNADVATSQIMLNNALTGNFPGIEIAPVRKETLKNEILSNFKDMRYSSLVSAIPALRSDSENNFVQGIEKFVDSMSGKTYSMVLVADSISPQSLEANRQALENIRTQLSPFAGSTYTFGESQSDSVNHSFSQGVGNSLTQSVSHSIANTVGNSLVKSTSETESVGSNTSNSTGHTSGNTYASSVGRTNSFSNTVSDSSTTSVGVQFGGLFSIFRGIGVSASESVSVSSSKTTSQGNNYTTSQSSSSSTNYATSVGSFSSRANTHGESRGTSTSRLTSKTDNKGWTENESYNATKGNTKTEGKNSSVQVRLEDFRIKRLMDRIKDQLDRYDRCADIGMWNCCTYFLSDTPDVSVVAASLYQSIICGKKSSVENDHIIYFDDYKTQFIKPYLACFEHPDYNGITPGTLISSNELSIAAGLPGKSLMGLPVVNSAAFGRSVSTLSATEDFESKINIGKIFHMNRVEQCCVDLNKDSLCSHVFITGSTGSGKSNAVYQLLNECRKKDVSFLVVEPAKGEYKNVFGAYSDVTVYGSNPKCTKLLKINPFEFSEEIHILEHVDRLVEIFNACWPMYAAMPAILKDAVIKAYEDVGWNMVTSQNRLNENFYPSFSDVTSKVRSIIESSEYDSENKGAYKGSLITRLNCLTNGINGLIFASDDAIPDAKLFDENVIVDISRVGSCETKSLIMGLLVMKLQEYRMSRGGMNLPLKHVTILEEAHNLLKRTSTEQSAESANLLGKSVEMLANSIAEMRTYGEGFVIADQSPCQLDMSVIRNTNTKIIMRLPDKNDRDLVGKSANLNEDQIAELSKLPCGVAAIYQNNWVEPILCKVKKAATANYSYSYDSEINEENPDMIRKKMRVVKMLCSGELNNRDAAAKMIADLSLPASIQLTFLDYVEKSSDIPMYRMLGPVVKFLLPQTYGALVKSYAQTSDPVKWSESVDDSIISIDGNIDMEVLREIRQIVITQYLVNETSNRLSYNEWRERGVI